MLIIVGEKTSMIYLGCFVVTAALTHIMALNRCLVGRLLGACTG
jgi:hypothetical protein